MRFSGDPGQLDANGLPPKVIPMDDGTFDETNVNANFDLVLISSTVDADLVGGRFRCLDIPMVFWEHGLLAPEGLAGGGGGTSVGLAGPDDLFSELFLLNNTHPITLAAR